MRPSVSVSTISHSAPFFIETISVCERPILRRTPFRESVFSLHLGKAGDCRLVVRNQTEFPDLSLTESRVGGRRPREFTNVYQSKLRYFRFKKCLSDSEWDSEEN